MSKVNAMQAIREARYAARAATKPATAPARVVADAEPTHTEPVHTEPVHPEPVHTEPTGPEPTGIEPAEALCGHRSMNNRICKRPAGHSEKNHRYN